MHTNLSSRLRLTCALPAAASALLSTDSYHPRRLLRLHLPVQRVLYLCHLHAQLRLACHLGEFPSRCSVGSGPAHLLSHYQRSLWRELDEMELDGAHGNV